MSRWSERKHFFTFCAIFAVLAGLLGAGLWHVLHVTGAEAGPPGPDGGSAPSGSPPRAAR